ncbi:MAG: phosphoribosylamine--glycine ligase [Actinomycetota bacterium]
MTRCVVVGSGAREHALAWGLRASCDVVVTPGNPGIAAMGIPCVSTSPTQLEADLFVIGPETPLVAGVADMLRGQGKVVFGPNADGAQLEGSKAYLKEFLSSAKVPTANFGTFHEEAAAIAYLRRQSAPYVIKTDGLAAGKGVLVTDSLAEAEADVRDKMSGESFGDAGKCVIIEEALRGEECSLLVVCDGQRAFPLVPAQDFKRVGDNDEGPNTGGMGAFAPLPRMSPDDVQRVMDDIIAPSLRELRRRHVNFRGVLYAGVMLTAQGPVLLEYNVRFGDPETQVLVPLLGEGLYDLLYRAATGDLHHAPVCANRAAVTVVLAAEGYPLSPRSGDVITGLNDQGQLLDALEGVTVFHSGTSRNEDGHFVTAGGRVVSVTAMADTLHGARALAYRAASRIEFAGQQFRTDIAQKYDPEAS